MRFNKLDLNLLVALDALLTERSVSRAAERVHLSQSAMSNSLGRLREHFDDELLVQVGRAMELTPRAEVLGEAVRDVLVRIDTTIAAQPEFTPAKSDRDFKIFVSDYSMATLMPHMLALAHRQSRTVRFQFLPQVASPQRALERGEADMLVIPQGYCSPDHPSETVFRETFCCAVWSRGTLATGELTMERYLDAGHVMTQPPGAVQPAFEAGFLQRRGVSRRVEVTTFSFTAGVHLVVGTDRIATVHTRLAQLARRMLPITLHPSPVPMPEMEQVMQWHKYRSLDPGLVWLRGLLHQAAAAMDAQQPAAAERLPSG